MLLGKRSRPSMRRTTSMTEMGFDLSCNDIEMPLQSNNMMDLKQHQKPKLDSAVRRNHRRNSHDFVETAPFLRACGLCKRRLSHGKDIYMYRGEIAFCSLECRQQQINHDERKEKCSLASMKKESSSATGSETSNNGETIVAA